MRSQLPLLIIATCLSVCLTACADFTISDEPPTPTPPNIKPPTVTPVPPPSPPDSLPPIGDLGAPDTPAASAPVAFVEPCPHVSALAATGLVGTLQRSSKEACAYIWVGAGLFAATICTRGWVCSLLLRDSTHLLVEGDDAERSVLKGSVWRYPAAYPLGDAIRTFCDYARTYPNWTPQTQDGRRC